MPPVKLLRALAIEGACLTLLGAGAACYAPLQGPPACDASRACASDGVCVVGRCRDAGTVPVSTLARRVQVAASHVAIIRDDSLHNSGEESASGERGFVLGATEGQTTVVVDFALVKSLGERPDAVERAVVVLEPHASPEARAGQLTIDVAELVAPWETQGLGFRTLPRTQLPIRLGAFVTAPMQPLSLDVTELVRKWIHGKRPYGLAILARGENGVRAWYANRESSRPSPRLDVYFAPDATGPTPEPAAPTELGPSRGPSRPSEENDESDESDSGGIK